MSIIAGQLQLIRALAIELHTLGRLDDGLLQRVQAASIKKTKGTIFSDDTQAAHQIRLMDFSIGAIQAAIGYLKANRDGGKLADSLTPSTCGCAWIAPGLGSQIEHANSGDRGAVRRVGRLRHQISGNGFHRRRCCTADHC
jgi:hypothetical protein